MTSEIQKTLPTTTFGDDDGAADPDVEAALSAYSKGEGGPADVLAALSSARLLIPVVALREGEEPPSSGEQRASAPEGAQSDSPRPDHPEGSVEMAAASTIGRDGRRGLLAFTSLENMYRWNPDARPVPVTTRAAAESAVADGADALVIDLAGPVLFSVDAESLRTLASGWRPVVAWGSA